MQEKMFGNEYHLTTLYIDAYSDHEFCGRLHNPCLDGPVAFHSLMQMILSLECLLDKMRFPQSFVAKRQFSPIRSDLPENSSARPLPNGAVATFAVRILFRQNASWQGSVTWVEKGRSESFRSALELFLLLHSALSEEKAL